MKLRHSVISCLLALGAVSSSAYALDASHQGYYRAPALHNSTVIFTAEGDLWKASLNNNEATRLTTQPAQEIDASISKDGKWVAYTANYEGASEVYVMGVDGGVAKRVTFENSRVSLQGWTASGELLYASNNGATPANSWVLKTVNPQTLAVTNLPLADAIEGAIDDKGEYVYFIQFGLQASGDNAKVYRGGAKGELWRFKLSGKQEAQKLTANHDGSVRQPMYWNERIYFVSDQSGNDNIWSMNAAGGDLQQLTTFTDWQVRDAKLDNGRIVFQQGADIKYIDIATKKLTTVDVNLTSDFAHKREKWVNNPMDYATSINLAHSEDKVVVTARSHIAVASQNGSRLVEIQAPANSRLRHGVMSDDGKYVYAISDASGEQEIWRFAADGSNEAKQLTHDGKTLRTGLHLSPNGNYIAHDDYHGNVWLLNLKNNKNIKIIQDGEGLAEYQDVIWSHDSRYLALTKQQLGKQRPQVVLYSISQEKELPLTTDKYESFSPSFSQDGNWLYFLSNRAFNAIPGSPWGDRNMGAIFDKRTEVYAFALNPDARFPFTKPTELTPKAPAADNADDAAKVNLDWDGLTKRLWQVPVASGNYSSLTAAKDRLYLLDAQATGANLLTIKFSHQDAKTEVFAEDVGGYQLAKNADKLMLTRASKPDDILIVPTADKLPTDLTQASVSMAQWQLSITPQMEWQQMFEDAWLMHRDSFYDVDMRGLDWQQTKAKYQPLVDRLTDRDELNDIFKQMMGELSSLHSQVRGGDVAVDPNKPTAALLGAKLSQDDNGVKIEHIYQTDPELPSQASPLAKMTVDAKNGDVIVAINGKKITTIGELTQALRNEAGKQTLLTLKRGRKLHQTVVTPYTSRDDLNMRYTDWVYQNMAKVDTASKGDIGYLHMYSMVQSDINSFAREYYANYDKQGLIIDVRRNRGGNIDSLIIEKLLRRAWAFWKPTYGTANANMQQTFRGHLVVLTDQMTYSDGETFAAGIKALGIAPLIGKQTAGAGVWLSGRNAVTDFGMARVAEYPQYSLDGHWIVEGHGIKPDIEVDNLPYATYQGKDAQLEAAIKYLKDEMKHKPIKPLTALPLPKTGHAGSVKPE
ncbi:S41 family peptidase [Shewanella intestini]|uniref:Tricorn protease homolog n=1 Tax=Shewanella intestini TaxID=2017544 RepID=A0ABS5I366_9GAMM|nr:MULTISPECIES: S41 family peptidase [Shewanella]MBR9728464.1 PDZ domain-containing protein [Shewanella intestini]MRG36283.1 PDZ domain-containing protein [Shewanella sp. XMDDZSB0408]